jgi:glutaminase
MNTTRIKRLLVVILSAIGLPTCGGAAADLLSNTDIETALNAAYENYRALHEGKNADYIPALAKVDPKIYGIALVTNDGRIYTAGDATSEVSIQSISKVFTMAKVIEESGPQSIEDNIGVDATGQVFNSIVAVEQNRGSEMNAMVNAGAITATSMVKGGLAGEIWNKIIAYVVSPPLDAAGNSVRAQRAIADISNALDGNPYAIEPRK